MKVPAQTLRTTLIAWTILAASVPALLVAFPLVGYIRWLTERTAIQELDLKASKVALALEQDIAGLLASGRGAVADSDVRRVLSSLLFMNRVDRLFADMVDKQPLIHELRLLNREGQIVSVAPPARAADPTANGVVDHLRQMVSQGERVPVARVIDGDLVLFVPVLGLVGDTAGVLAIKIQKNTLSERAGAVVDDATVRILLAETREDAVDGLISASASLRLGGMTRDPAALYEVRVEEPAARRLLPVRLLTIRLSAGVAILVFLFAMLGWSGARRLTAPLAQLTQLVREVAAGRYVTKAPVVPFQELQDFAGTLAGLGQAVTAQMQTIREQEQVKGELERAQVQSELDAMRSQMNPHFLFNSLNSVSTIASIDAGRAQEMISRLADLYRGILDSSKTATSPLKHEIEIASNYLELEKMRFGERLTYEIDAPPDLGHLYAPGLLLQTLVENAVKHGVGPSRQGGKVSVKVEAADGGLFRMTVRNTGAAFDGRRESAQGGTGIANTIRRLDLLYGTRHRFHLAKEANGETVASFVFTGERK